MFLSENLDRRYLCDYEKAVLIEAIHKSTRKTYEEIAGCIGKSKAFVSQHIAMLHLFSETLGSEDERKRVLSFTTERHARILTKISDPEDRWNTAKFFCKANLGAREAERYCAKSERSDSDKSQSHRDAIKSLIVDFISGVSGKNIPTLFDTISSRHFSMFPSFPPFSIMDRDAAKKYFFDILAEVDAFEEIVNNLDIRVCGRIAYVTMFVQYDIGSKRKMIKAGTRATIILENEDGKWKIVHGHWSSADPKQLLAVVDSTENELLIQKGTRLSKSLRTTLR
jgi:ketosteroid isomerase-like protein